MINNAQSIHIKKEILVRLIMAFYSQNFEQNARAIPYEMRPKGSGVPFRCCIHKERAIIKDRLIAGLGFSIENADEKTSLAEFAKLALERENVENRNLTVLQDACKGCVTSQIFVTDLCQGCVARPCLTTCKFGAVTIEDGKSHIDNEKCKKCQMCVKACPYKAIVKKTVPCEDVCPVGAIKKDETGFASIDFEKCINCGKCISTCPFGAVHEKSQIIDILKALVSDKKVIAMLAPSIVGQFPGTIYQLKNAIKKAGFDDVIEVALGANITTKNEAKEFQEKMNEGQKFMTTSCCAGYNQFVEKHLEEMKPFVSHTKTPMHYSAKYLKENNPDVVTVFVSPCVAKRTESFNDEYVDLVMNFEELGALLIAKKIEVLSCEDEKFEKDSSKQGRNFGVSGGVAQAVSDCLEDKELIKPLIVNGIDADSIKTLKKIAKEGECEGCNMVEVMCCEGGCICGNATLNNPKMAKKQLDNLLLNSEDIQKIK